MTVCLPVSCEGLIGALALGKVAAEQGRHPYLGVWVCWACMPGGVVVVLCVCVCVCVYLL